MSRPSIQPLPVQAQLQLKSSVALNSLNDAVVGLVKNALDAQAQTVQVNLDFSRGSCCVEDDGVGIPAAEFDEGGGLGQMHCKEFKSWEYTDMLTGPRHFEIQHQH
jgi:DNA mismatch repair protein MLH3